MKIFMTFSALILCFVIHGVLTGRLIPSTRIVLDKCFQNFYSNNCSGDFEKVISTVSNKWCCIKFIYNEKDDDEALQNNVMTSSGNDTKIDNGEKYQNSMLDETDSINVNEAIYDSSLSFIENPIDSQLNGATDDKYDNAESMQQANENFENIERNLNANEIENELSDTRMNNQDDFKASKDNDDEIGDLSDKDIEDNDENLKIAPKSSNEHVKDNLIKAAPIDYMHDDEYSEEFEEVQKFDQDLNVILDKDTENKIPQYLIDKNKAKGDDTEEYPDGIRKYSEDPESSIFDENFSSDESYSTDSMEYTDTEELMELNENNLNKELDINDSENNIDKDLATLSEESNDIKDDIDKSSNKKQSSIDLESDLDINDQFDKINEDDVDKDSAELNIFNNADSNQENESSEDVNSVYKNLISDDNDNTEFNNNQLGDDTESEVSNLSSDDESFEEFQESSLQDEDSTNTEGPKNPNEDDGTINLLDILNPISAFTTKSSFRPSSKRRSKLNVLNKIKSNQPPRINMSPKKSFKNQFANKLTQRSQRLNFRKNQSNINLNVNSSESHKNDVTDSEQLLEVDETTPEIETSSNDDNLNELPEQHDDVESRRHEDIINAYSEDIIHDDAENENSLNNSKSSSKSSSIESELNNENIYPDTEEEKSRQQQISKLSKQSPASDSNDSLQSDNLGENESNQVEDSVTEKVKNDNNELQFENSIDEHRQREDENLQHDYNRVDDNDREYENDELKNNQIGDEIDGNGGDESATTGEMEEVTKGKGSIKRRPALINKLGMRVDREDSDEAKETNILEENDAS